MEAHAVSERPSSLARSRAASLAWRITPALLLACVLVGAWLLVDPRSPDLAAQSYRETLFARYGFTLWDNNWYAGHHLPGYSLIFPWLALAFGMRVVGALAVLVSTFAFERIAVSVYGPRARWGAVCFAIAAAGDLWIGRITFALGVSFAMLAVLAVVRRMPWLAAVLTAVCAASSPVAGLLLALAAASYAIATRRLVLSLVLPAVLVVLPLEALFPEGGWEPFALSSILANVAVVLAFLYALPRGERTLRIGAFVYLFAVLASIVPAPMGSNIDRYAVLLAAPLLVCVLARDGLRANGRPVAATVAAVAGILIWTGWGPVRESAGVSGDPSTSVAYYRPLERFLASHGGPLVRVEIPFTHSHWEAALVAPDQPLARGWERQLDTKYDGIFFSEENLSPSSYANWLHNDAVSYVALPDVRLDGSSDQEAALIRHGQPFLREVLRAAHWRVFAVLGSAPLASAPARLTALGHDSFALRFARAGRSLVRVRYTRYWTPSAGACVSEAAGGWTAVSARSDGVVRVSTRFSLERALGLASGCSF
ncbi:MAG TPA: hypothetical protein VHS55_02855 [Solirubrobacteraceae bacterium]|nr:hypothetical protein [Solirubrobacteraceae bacterium]